MPRDAVAVTQLATGAAVAQPAGTPINTTNGATIAAAAFDRVAVRVTNTSAAPRVVTFKAGTTNPPAVRKGLGDLAVTVPLTTGDVLVVLESARFAKPDGTIDVDFAASTTGVISAVALPKAA